MALGDVYAGVSAGIPDQLEGRDELERPEGEEQPRTPQFGDPARPPGKLLALPPAEAMKYAIALYVDQKDLYQRPTVEWEVNARRREGEHSVWAIKTQDQNQWRVYVPPGHFDKTPVPVLAKAKRLCERVTSRLFADPAVPDPQVEQGGEQQRDSRDFAKRLLLDLDGQATLDHHHAHRDCFNLTHDTGHAFIFYRVDQYAGGRQPVMVEAGPQAQTMQDAKADPLTGQPWPELVTRYVTQDGLITDTAGEAALRWVPQITRRILPAQQVRLLPVTSSTLWDAEGVVLCGYDPFRVVAKWFPDTLQALGDDEIKALVKQRPPETEHLLPKMHRKERQTKDPRDSFVFWVKVYYRECADYEDGVYFCGIGESKLVHRGDWIASKPQRSRLELPLTQHVQFGHGPIHVGLMQTLGPAGEFRAQMVGAVVDTADRKLNRKTFIPTNSILQGQEAMLPLMTHVPINPGGEPRYEEVPDAPQEAKELIQLMTEEMNDEAGLQDDQGQDTPNVQSGRHALTLQAAVNAGLSGLRGHCVRAIERGWMVVQQLVREGYDVPQIQEWEGEDGEYKATRWQGSDLVTLKDVRVKAGSFASMTAEAKAQRALAWIQTGALSPDDVQRTLFEQVAPEMGWEDNPHVMRVRRSIAKWEQGPPEGWQPPPMTPPQVQGVDPRATR